MLTELFPIEGPWRGRLAISARPRGGDWLSDEMRSWRRAGMNLVVSLLMPEESLDLDLAQEREMSEANEMEFYSLPIPDRGVPASEMDAARLLSKLDSKLGHGKNVVVHCRQGVGRAGMIAVALLVGHGLKIKDAIQRVSNARGVSVPETPAQCAWIDSFAATLAEKPSHA